jgi:CBS domain-containing protein
MDDLEALPSARRSAVIETLRAHAPFDRMDEEHLEFLTERLSPARYPAGGVLLDPSDGPPAWLFIVEHGTVVAEAPGEGPEGGGARAELFDGECFPLGALLTGRPVHNTYRAVTSTSCYRLPAGEFQTVLELSAVFQDFCTRRLAHLLDESQRAIQSQYAREALTPSSLGAPLAEAVRRPPVACRPDTPLREALARMQGEGIGAMVATTDDGRPVGIFTLRDLLRVTVEGADLAVPLERVMTPAPVTLPTTAAAHDAALAMARHGIGHVLVVDRGSLVGLVSEKDLFALQQVGIKEIADTVARASACEHLQRAAHDIRRLARNLLAQGVAAEPLTRLVSALNDRLTSRVIELSGAAQALAGVRWCWLALGSEGRFEQTLATDQDNAVIFEGPESEPPAEVRARILPLAARINQELDRCGFPLGKGGLIAGSPKWCLSVGEWQARFAGWVERAGGDDLLSAEVAFDFRGVHGETTLAEDLRGWLEPVMAANPRFVHQMAANALLNRPPLGLVRDFVLDSGGEHPHTLNLKLSGAAPFVDAARVYALAAGVPETNTAERLRAVSAVFHFPPETVQAWTQAFSFIQLLRLRRQEPERAGEAGNRVDPDQLNELDRRILKESFRQARKLQMRLALDYNLYGRV